MLIFKETADLKHFINSQPSPIGFIPTMGALHQGHLSLIQKASQECKITVCSIFVNPTQFNDPSDFEKYPVTLDQDILLLNQVRTDVLFLPSVKEMYPDGLGKLTQYDIGYLDTILDGKFRPGHFNGVCNIVETLLRAVDPDKLYMGEKDFQQCLVVKRLIELMKCDIELITCPTRRENNGLAMSSRNERLSKAAREKASAIYYCLHSIKEDMKKRSFDELRTHYTNYLQTNGFETEYLLLADANNLHMLEDFDVARKMVILIATKLEGVRLIDNLRIN